MNFLKNVLEWLDEFTNRESTSECQYRYEGRVFKYFKPKTQKLKENEQD